MFAKVGIPFVLYYPVVTGSAGESESTFAKSKNLCFSAGLGPPDCDLASDPKDQDCLTNIVGTCTGDLKAPTSYLSSRLKGLFVTKEDFKYLSTPECTWDEIHGQKGVANMPLCEILANHYYGDVSQDTNPPDGPFQSAMVGGATTALPEIITVMPTYMGVKTVMNMGDEEATLKQSPIYFADVDHPTTGRVSDHHAPLSHLLCPDDSNKGPYHSRSGKKCTTTVAPGQALQTIFTYSSGEMYKASSTDIRSKGYKANGIRVHFEMNGSFMMEKWKINDVPVIDIPDEKLSQIDIKNISLQQKNGEGILYTFPKNVYYGKLQATGMRPPNGTEGGQMSDPDKYHMLSSLGMVKTTTVRMHNVQVGANEQNATFELDYIIMHEGEIASDQFDYAVYSPIVTAISAPKQTCQSSASPESPDPQTVVSVVATVGIFASWHYL